MAPRSVTSEDLLGQIVDDARQLGWLVVHATDTRRRATVAGRKVLIPDPEGAAAPSLFLAHPATGRAMAITIARDREVLTEDQTRWLEALDAAGIETQVIRPSTVLAGLGALHRLVAA